MKLAIIGAGNMGSAIARGLIKGKMITPEEMFVSNPSMDKLNALKSEFPAINITFNNVEAGNLADILIIAVKPWVVEKVLREIKPDRETILVSVAAGITFDELAKYVPDASMPMFRFIPNTAIRQMQSMNLIAARGASSDQIQFVTDMLDATGRSLFVREENIQAATSLASCGIAYVFKYMEAAMQAGVEMGLTPSQSMELVAQSALGAAKILLEEDTHPALEIDKVCTPGGYTIKGINSLEHDGFSSAVINALLKSK